MKGLLLWAGAWAILLHPHSISSSGGKILVQFAPWLVLWFLDGGLLVGL